jgi:hypothetical protein
MASPPPRRPLLWTGIGPKWKEWFAWHPVRLKNGEWRWLVKVFRLDVGNMDIIWIYVSHKDGLLKLLKQ